jgi:NAD(P)-dependent dehydrogenase (short-subunit alcohol dehydrogenase family)
MISEPLRNPLSLFDVKGKVAVITGASGSFGRACALALGSLGAKLVLASGSHKELDGVIAEAKEVGADVTWIKRRPEKIADAEAILKAGLDAFGHVDMLVVASGSNKAGFIQDQTYEEWQGVMDANVRGEWLMAKAVGTYWIKEGVKGKALLLSSTRGRHGNFSGYTALAPTTFRSKLTEWMWKDDEVGKATRTRTLSRIPLGRLGEAEDLVGMALYLLSPASSFCTGQVMYVDGGFTAG